MKEQSPSPFANSHLPRPTRVTFLALGVFILAMIHWLRFTGALRQWDFLAGLLTFSPIYLALTGLFWSLSGLFLAWGLWSGRHWAPAATRIGLLAFSAYYWIDRLWLGEAGTRRGNGPFVLVATLFLLALVFWILSQPKVRFFFGETHGNQPENPRTA